MKKLLTLLALLLVELSAYAQREILMTKEEFARQLHFYSAGASRRYAYNENLEGVAKMKSVYYCQHKNKSQQHFQLPTITERFLSNRMDTTGLVYREFYFKCKYKKREAYQYYIPKQLSRKLNKALNKKGGLRDFMADSTYSCMAYYASFDGKYFHTTFIITNLPATDADLDLASVDNPEKMLSLLNQYRSKQRLPSEAHLDYPKVAPLQYHHDLEKAAKIQAIHLMNEYTYRDVLRIKQAFIEQYGKQEGIKKARVLAHSHPKYPHSLDRVKAASPQTAIAFSVEEVFRWDHYENNMELVALSGLSASPDHYQGMMQQQFTHMGSFSVYDAQKHQYIAVIVMGYLKGNNWE